MSQNVQEQRNGGMLARLPNLLSTLIRTDRQRQWLVCVLGAVLAGGVAKDLATEMNAGAAARRFSGLLAMLGGAVISAQLLWFRRDRVWCAQLNKDRRKFDEIRRLLGTLSCTFFVVYCPKPGLLSRKLKWCNAVCPGMKTREEIDLLAAKHLEFATYCYRNRRDMTILEYLPAADSTMVCWMGVDLPRGGSEQPGPADSQGRRWWLVGVGNGALRRSGYSLVARIPATTEEQVHVVIDHIQSIMHN